MLFFLKVKFGIAYGGHVGFLPLKVAVCIVQEFGQRAFDQGIFIRNALALQQVLCLVDQCE